MTSIEDAWVNTYCDHMGLKNRCGVLLVLIYGNEGIQIYIFSEGQNEGRYGRYRESGPAEDAYKHEGAEEEATLDMPIKHVNVTRVVHQLLSYLSVLLLFISSPLPLLLSAIDDVTKDTAFMSLVDQRPDVVLKMTEQCLPYRLNSVLINQGTDLASAKTQ